MMYIATSDSNPVSLSSLKSCVEEIDWRFIDAETQYLTHNLHRYSGKYIPQIAKKAIELISKPGETILDPYVGSGTTILEAALTGRNAIGVDLNPLAVLITSAKVRPIKKDLLNSLYNKFYSLIKQISDRSDDQLSLYSECNHIFDYIKDDWRLNHPWYTKWFQKPVLEELLYIYNHINTLDNPDQSRLAKVAFSDILRKCSNAHSGYPNVMYDRNSLLRNGCSLDFLKSLKRCIDMVASIEDKIPINCSLNIFIGDATNLPIDDSSVDAIVTHPPYIGSIPYAEYGALSLEWLGYNSKDIDAILTGGKRQSRYIVERFENGYRSMLSESFRVLKPKKIIFIMVGNPLVRGSVIDLALMTKRLSIDTGFTLIAETTREGVNRRANKMGLETLLLFKK